MDAYQNAINQFAPPSLEEYEKQRRREAALAAGSAMLMASGGNRNLAQALGAGGMAALGSRNNAPSYQDQVLAAMKMQQTQQGLQQQQALNQALPELAAKDFAPEAVLAAVRQYPGAALGIQKMADERTKVKLDQEKARAEVQDKRLKIAEKFGNKAAYLAKNKELTPAQVQSFVQDLDKNGVADIVGTVPFQSWANPEEARSNLSAMASMFYDIKDREAQALTERGQNLTRDTAVRGQDLSAETQRRGQDMTQGTSIRGQNLVDARSREANTNVLTGKVQEQVAGLRKEFNGLDEVKNYKAVVPMVESARKAPDTPAGDLDIIYAVGKVLDPGSVVREGELNLVIKSGTPMEQFSGYARSIAQGKGRLPPEQRAKLVAMLEGRMGELAKNYARTRSVYEAHAERGELPKEQIFSEPAPQAAPVSRKVVKTGKSRTTGRTVVQYDDGSLEER